MCFSNTFCTAGRSCSCLEPGPSPHTCGAGGKSAMKYHDGREIFRKQMEKNNKLEYECCKLHHLCFLVVCLNLGKTGKGVHSTNVHCAGAADSLPTASPEIQSTSILGPTHEIKILLPESEAGVHLILDLDEGVQHHGATVVEVHLVLLHPGLVSRLFWVPSEHTGL